MNTKIFISSNPDTLAEALSVSEYTATVEAEYGDRVVEGTMFTLAHHGPRSGNPCPCLTPNYEYAHPEAIGVSHIDLDTLGGITALLGRKKEVEGFWELAAFVDENGPHKLKQANASEENLCRLYAWWAIAKDDRIFAPRDGSVLDITNRVFRLLGFLDQILNNSPKLLQRGEYFKNEEQKRNEESFVEYIPEGGVVVRCYHEFTSSLYETPTGEVGKAVVAFNTKQGNITVSFADLTEEQSACEIVQTLWGNEAGGHKGIAGSPRGQRMTLHDLGMATNVTKKSLVSENPSSWKGELQRWLHL